MDNNEKMPEEGYSAGTETVAQKLDNFWYHYKWHTIVSIFIIFVLAVCTFQMCSRTSYDAYVMYSGGKSIAKTLENSEYANIRSAFALVCPDFDGDGQSNPHFQSYLTPTDEEYAKNFNGKGLESVIVADKDSFNTAMLGSQEYYLCFLSAANFEVFDAPIQNGAYPLITLTDITSDENLLTESGRGIYLSATDFYKLPGISSLPDDTVICIRQKGVGGDKENFENAKVLLKCILDYKYE